MRPSIIHVLARALRWTAVELQHDRALQLARLQGREEAQGDASRSKSIRPAAAEAVGKWEKCDSIFPKAGSARRLSHQLWLLGWVTFVEQSRVNSR